MTDQPYQRHAAEVWASYFLAHNLMLIAFDRYNRRQISLAHYVGHLAYLCEAGRSWEGWARIEATK